MSIEPFYCRIDLKATGENISRLLQTHGLTVKELQMYMGFGSSRSIYKWMEGKTVPSLDNLIVLSQVLQVPMDDIVIWIQPSAG